ATFLKNNLHKFIIDHKDYLTNTNTAIKEAFKKADETFKKFCMENSKKNLCNSGSTALACIIQGNCLIVANCGDSRAVLAHSGIALPMSEDHKPNRYYSPLFLKMKINIFLKVQM